MAVAGRARADLVKTVEEIDLAAGRPPADVPAGLATRARRRFLEERAAARAYRRWTVGLAAAAVVLAGAAAAIPPPTAESDDPFEAPSAEVFPDAANGA